MKSPSAGTQFSHGSPLCRVQLQPSTLLRSPAGLRGDSGVAAGGVTHSIAGMFGADMGLTSLAF